MPVTENILKVQNVQGAITTIKDYGAADAKLVNQEYDLQNNFYTVNRALEENATIDASAQPEHEDYKGFSYTREKPIKEIPLDVVVRYTPEVSTTITANPTQIGVNVNDHVYSNPDTMMVQFGISDIKGTIARLTGVVKSFSSADALKNPVTPSRALLNLLYRAKEEHTLLAIDDGLHAYTDMVITNITYDKDKSTYRSLVATVTLQQFIFVNTEGDEIGSTRPQVVPGNASTFAKVWDRVTAIRIV